MSRRAGATENGDHHDACRDADDAELEHPMMNGMMPMMGGMMPMMGGMMPMMGGMMPMSCRMTCEMTKDGMMCRMMPADPSQMDQLKACCEMMMNCMQMGMPCMMMCNGMPMMMCTR